MYCPKCGTALVTRQDMRHGDTYLYCEPGEMVLSRSVQEALDHRYGANAPPSVVQQVRPAPSPTYPHEWGWYCPGCGVPLDGWLECPRCGKHLRDLAYQLVELHPHRPDPKAPVRLSAQVLGLGRVQERSDQVEVRVELHGEALRRGPARLRTHSGSVRPVWVIACEPDASQHPRHPRRARVVVEGVPRSAFQAGAYLEQETRSAAQDHERQASGEGRPDAE